MKSHHRTRTVRALSLAAFAAIPSLAARGQAVTSTWLPLNASENWNVAANWDRNAVPTSGTNTVLVFGGSGTDSYVATQNIANPFTLNKIQFTSNSSNPIVVGGTVSQTAANTITLSGTGATVSHTGSGDVYLNAPITLGANTTFDVTGTGALYMLSDFAASASSFTKTGSGTMYWGTTNTTTVNLTGGTSVVFPARALANALTGDVNVNAGTLVVGNTGASFLSNGSLVTIAAGATFDFRNNDEDFGSVQGAGTLMLNGAGMTTGLDNRSVTWSGQIIGTDPTVTMTKSGTGTWTITTQQPYQSKSTVANGGLTLSGGGSIRFSSEVAVGAGAKLTLDNTAGNADRIGDELTVILNGNSELVMAGSASSNSQEQIGATVVRGLTTFTLLPGAGRAAQITAGAVLQEPGGAPGGMVLFRGNKLGQTPGGADTSTVMLFYTPDLVGGGGAAGSTTQSILPFGLGDTSPTGSGNSLVTYNSSTGIRPLTAAEYANLATAGATDNARVAAAASGLAGKTVNSLVVDNSTAGAITVDGTSGQTLAVTSGAVLFSGAQPITLSGFGALDFGTEPAYISSANSHANGATISTPITGSGGVVKSGAGVLALTAANTYSGGTVLNSGTLRVANDNNLGATSGSVAFNAGTFQLSANVNSNRTFTANGGGVGTIDTNGFTLTLSRVLAGTGQFTKTGAGTLVVPEFGGTNLGTITLNGGTIRVTVNNTTGTDARDFVLLTNATNTIDTNGFNATMGNTSGAGGFTKTGAGTLLMQGANTFDGDITISQGTVKIIGTAGSFFEDSTYANIAAGATLDMSDNSEQWGGISGAGTILTGTVTNVDVNVVGTRNATFSGVIQGAGDFIKNGTHVLTMSGASTYTGANDINGGTLVINANVLPNQAGPLGQSAGVISLGNTSGAVATSLLLGQAGVEFGRNINVRTGNTGLLTLGSNHTTGTSKISGNVALAKALTVSAAAGGTTEFTGVISGTATAATLTKAGAGTINLNGVNSYVGATTVNAGTLRVTGSVTNSASLTVNNTGTFEAGASQTLKSLVVNAGGKANITAPAAVLTAKALTVNATGRMDLATGMLVVDYTSPAASPAAAIRTALAAGRGTGNWAGANGITSSAITNATRSLGYAEASKLVGATGGTYNGATLDADAVVVRMTVSGDATMDGTVNFDDLLSLAANYNSTAGTWQTGDFDYSSVVNFDDLLILASNYNSALAAPTPAELAGQSAAFQADVAAAFAAAVPEPSTAALVLAAGGLVMSTRRRRRGC